MTKLLERLGLGRPDLRAWAMYDWANSAFQTTIIAAVFPIYFHSVVAVGLGESLSTSRFAWATTIAILIVLSSLSSRHSKWIEIAIETVVLIVGCWAVFINGLELPFPLWWGE